MGVNWYRLSIEIIVCKAEGSDISVKTLNFLTANNNVDFDYALAA